MKPSQILACRALALGVAALLLAQAARAADAPADELLPPACVSDDAAAVLWLDLRPMDGPTIGATSEALAPLAGGENDQYLQRWKAVADVAQSLRGAGVELVALPIDQSAVAGETTEPAGRDVPATRPATIPANGVAAIYFLRLRPGADRAAVETAFRGSFRRLAAVADDPEHAPDPEKIRFRPRGDRWLDALPEPAVTPAEGDAAATGRFAAALADTPPDGPALRVAVVLPDAARQRLAEAALTPSGAFFRGVIDGLRTMKHVTVGLTVGEKPEMAVALRLDDESAATAMKQNIDALTAMAGLFLANSDDPKQAEYLRAALSMVSFDRDGSRLTRTITLPTALRLKRLSEAAEASTRPATGEALPN